MNLQRKTTQRLRKEDSLVENCHLVKKMIFLFFLFSIFTYCVSAQTIKYVKQDGTGSGTSWADASGNLQAMINASLAGDQIWVAAGTYIPTTDGNRFKSFVMKNNLAIYGGFVGTETQLSQRNWNTNITILSGDLTGNDNGFTNNEENSYHVINNNNNGLNATALLDGFTIAGGNANGWFPENRGGGIYNDSSSPTLMNVIISGNTADRSGGIHNNHSSPTLINVTISGNFANSNAGGVYNNSSSPTFSNVTISGNTAMQEGGGIWNNNSTSTLTNVTISGNTAQYGGGIHNNGTSSPTLTNVIISGNTAFISGGGIYNKISSPNLTNVLISGNTAYNYGGGIYNYSGNGNFINVTMVNNGTYGFFAGNHTYWKNSIIWDDIRVGNYSNLNCLIKANNSTYNDTDIFANPGNGDYSLKSSSIAINTGDNSFYPGNINTDLDLAGQPRLMGTNIDLGAYEYNPCPSGNILYVNKTASGANTGESWTNAYTELQDALTQNCPNITEIWVAKGTYQPALNTSFAMKNGVAIYGGFDDTGNPTMADRNWKTYPTILQGNGSSVIKNHNTAANPLLPSAVLDGFAVTGGNSTTGGGIYAIFASPTLTNLTVSGNTANSGGGMYNLESSPTLTNVTLSGNSANDTGGGIYNNSGDGKFINCTITGNSPNEIFDYGYTYWKNTIVWGNIDGYNYSTESCLIKGNNNYGNGNIIATGLVDTDIFSNPSSGDYSLIATSPVINAGSNQAYTNAGGDLQNDLDLAGNPRVFNYANSGVIDMGAYEFQDEPCVALVAPWSEDFESGVNGNLITDDLSCWSQEYESGTLDWNFVSGNQDNSITPHSGSLMAELRNTTPGTATKLISPTMDLTSLNPVQLTFYFANVNWAGDIDELRVYYKKSVSDPDWTLIDGAVYTTEHTSWEEVALILPETNGASDYVIAFEATSNWGRGLDLDDISVGSAPICPIPNGLTVNNITSQTADVSWVAGYNETQWQVKYGSSGFDPETEGILKTETGSPLSSLVGLDIGMQYDVYVKADCGGGDQSDFVGPLSFFTLMANDNLCDAIPLTVDATCAGDAYLNIGAAGQTGEIAGSCFDTNGLLNSVWFSFDAPPSGDVTVTTDILGGTLTDTQIAVYAAPSDCSDLTTLGSEIGCDQDGGEIVGNGWNSVVSIAGLTAGATYYIQVDGYNNQTGSFGIEVRDNETIQPTSTNILYVDKNVSGGNATGDSWANAVSELADALKYAKIYATTWSAGTIDSLQIWVAGGTYKPLYSPADNNFGNDAGRDNSFLMVNNVQLYGGFAGTEAALAERDLSIMGNETILSGDVNSDDVVTGSGGSLSITNNGENNYRVIVSAGAVGTALLDGFTITGGNALGIIGYLTVNDENINRIYGGGMHNYSSSPTLTNVTLSGNRANSGGGMYNSNSSPTLINTNLSGNSAAFGGGIYNYSSSLFLVNTTLSGNSASTFGGGMFNYGSPTLTNVTISGNTAASGAEWYNDQGYSVIRNSIIYGNGINGNLNNNNQNIHNSILQDHSSTANGDIYYTGDVNDLFTDATNGDFSLLATSPAINAGSNQAYTDAGGDLQNDVDLAGNPRVFNYANSGIIDMGAYEFQGDPINLSTNYFITTWQTDSLSDGSSSATSITIPTYPGESYNYDVSWENDGVWETGFTGNASHDYGTAGMYTVAIRGNFPHIYFNYTGDRKKLISVDQWGTIAWSSMNNAFAGCHNMDVTATDIPDLSSVTDMSRMFVAAYLFNGDLGNWDVSNVTNMAGLFRNTWSFNKDISNWDVSNVTNMVAMFYRAMIFNQDISNWNVSNVTNMSILFNNAQAFNQSIGNWDVSNVNDMSHMFLGAYNFDQYIGSWNVGNVSNMQGMFVRASAFNQDIGMWDVSKAVNMIAMFQEATAFNQDLSNWEVDSVTDMRWMFYSATNFDQNIGDWNVSNVAQMDSMFYDVTLSMDNYDALLIGWDAQNLQPNVNFDGGNSLYCAGSNARANMIASDGWTISDGGSGAPVIDIIVNQEACDIFTLPVITGINLSGDQKYYTATNGAGTAYAAGTVLSYASFSSYPVTLYAYGTSVEGCSDQQSFELIINQNDISDVTFDDGTFTYSGNSYSLAVVGLPSGASVSYSANNGQSEAGSYPITATISSSHTSCSDIVLNATLTINKAQAVITATTPQTFTYDGTVKNVVASLNNNEGVLSYDPQQGYTEVGTYAITISSDESANYLAASANVSLVIEPASQSGITFADGTFTYDGTAHSIFVSNLPAGATVVYANNGQTESGTYTVTATVSQDNYADEVLTADLTINKAQAVITAVSPQTFTYDGTVKNVVATLNNSEGILSYDPQQGYTEVGTYAITISSDESANYLAASANVSLVIDPASQSGITFADGTFTYDGTAHSIFVSNLPAGATVVYANNGQTESGTYTVTATVSQDNYADEVLTADLTINKAQAVITAVSPQTFMYDGTVKNVVASLNNSEGILSYAPQQGYTEVGTYAITISSDESANYLAASANVSLVIDPASQSGITFVDGTFTYDGTAHNIFVSNLPAGATVVYDNNGQTESGTYTVTATVSQDNYADEVLTADLTINKAQAVITATTPQTFTYDGTVKNVVASLNNSEGILSYDPQQGYTEVGTYSITVSSAETANYLAASANVSLVIDPASQSGITFADGTFTYDGTAHSIFVSNLPAAATVVYDNNGQSNAGTYTVTATVSQDNYADEVLTADLTINKAQAVITAITPQTFAYDGTVKNIVASLNNSEGVLSYAPQQGYTEVGTYSITVSSAETANYLAASEVVSLVIDPASQSGITFADGTFTYDGTAHSIFVSNLPAGATVVYDNNGQTNAGTYTVTATVSQDNYADEVLTADLTINKAQAVITAVSPQTFTYDGTVKNVVASLNNSEGILSYDPQQGYTEVGTYSITVSSAETANYLAASEVVSLVIDPASQSGITFADGTFTYDGTAHSIFVSNLPTGATVVYDNNGQTNAGTYTVTATVSQDNYADEVLTADLTINKAQAVITAVSPQTFTYDGTVKNVVASLNNSEGILSYDPQQGYTEVGTYAITVSSAETANYLAASEVVSLVIDPASQSGITFADGTFTYDGTAHSIFVSNLPAGATVVYDNNGQTESGTYTVTATVSQDNYADEVLTADLTINKAQAVITAVSPQTFTYDGTVKNVVASLNHSEGVLSYDPQQGYTEAGTYSITVSSDETANYLAASEVVSLVIDPASQSGITFADGTFTYDGTAHSIFVSNLPAGATVVYDNNGQTNAGTYTVTATVSQDNYADEVLTADLTINKAQAVITATTPQTFTYDGTVKNVVASLNNSEGVLSYDPQQGYTEVGTYSITVSSYETANYLAASEVVSLVIDPASQSGITFADGTFTYDGTAHSIFVSNLPAGATVVYDNNGQTESGTYTVTATVSQDNYADEVLTADLTINKAQAVITAVSPQTFTYDGTVKNIVASLNNSEGILSYDPQQGYTEVGTYAITVSSAETANYLAASANVSLEIYDVTAPIPNLATLPPITGECAVLASDISIPTATDDSDGQINGTTTDALNYFNQGNYIITWIYTDGSGNTASQTQEIIVQDNLPPTVICPNNSTIEISTGSTGVVFNYDLNASDNCAVVVTQTSGLPSGSLFPVGITTNSFNISDPSGNLITCSFNVTVNAIDCPILGVNNGDPCIVSGQSGEYVNCECLPYDCNGIAGGTASLDECNICSGGNTGLTPNESCTDCNGVLNGTAYLDNCGECVGGDTGLEACLADCNGDYGGTATLDDCGVCDSDPSNDNTTCLDCAGVVNGDAYEDACGVCDNDPSNDNASCTDCNGVLNGTAYLDNCAACVGGDTGLEACLADCNGDYGGTATLDDCGVCSGGDTGLAPNESCTDCEGVVNGDALPGSLCFNGNEAGVYNVDCECVSNDLGSINGNVGGLLDCGVRNITISIFNDEYPQLNDVFTAIIDANGDFVISGFSSGTYSILIKVDGYLAKLYPDEIIESGINPVMISDLIIGDIDNSNCVNLTDFSTLNAVFGSVDGDVNYNYLADLNCDGLINVVDVSILNSAFGMAGDGPPPGNEVD